jgi:hypothetical protein
MLNVNRLLSYTLFHWGARIAMVKIKYNQSLGNTLNNLNYRLFNLSYRLFNLNYRLFNLNNRLFNLNYRLFNLNYRLFNPCTKYRTYKA